MRKLVKDVLCGKMSPERARTPYSVAIGPVTHKVDATPTTPEREAMRRAWSAEHDG